MTNLIRIAIIDDNIMIRSGLRMVLSKTPDFDVIAEVGFGEARRVLPNLFGTDVKQGNGKEKVLTGVVVMRMEQKESSHVLNLVHEVRWKYPHVQLLILANSTDDPFVLRALKAGVKGCLVNESPLKEIDLAIREIANGNVFIPSSASARLIEQLPEIIKEKEHQTPIELPAQQLRVLKLIFQGYSNEEIARELVISKRTVDMHTYRLFKRLNVSSRTQAIQAAMRVGLIDFSSSDGLSPV